jgi:hypothetical protein
MNPEGFTRRSGPVQPTVRAWQAPEDRGRAAPSLVLGPRGKAGPYGGFDLGGCGPVGREPAEAGNLLIRPSGQPADEVVGRAEIPGPLRPVGVLDIRIDVDRFTHLDSP